MKRLEYMLNGKKKSKKEIEKDKEKGEKENKGYFSLMHKSFPKGLEDSLSKF